MAEQTCIHCHGRGEVPDRSKPQYNPSGTTYPNYTTCPVCGGRGKTGTPDVKKPNPPGGVGSGCLVLAIFIVAVSGLVAIVLF